MRDPWKQPEAMDPDTEYLVMASSLPARDYAATPALFRGAQATKRQLRDAEGLIGFSMLARPVRKQYGSLSVWRDEAALRAFARTTPHGQLMRDLAPRMGQTTFVRWTITGADGRPSWREAWRRLDAADAAGQGARPM